MLFLLHAFPQKLLRQLATEEDDAAAQALLKHVGVPAKEYHLEVLKKVLSLSFCWFNT